MVNDMSYDLTVPSIQRRSEHARRPFNGRAFVALMAAISGIALPVTGLGNHLSQAHPLTNPYHAWMSAHNSLGVVFCVFAIWHAVLHRRALLKHLRGVEPRVPGGSREVLYVVLNRRVLLKYQRGARPRARGSSREAVCAAALVTVVLLTALAHL